MINLSSDNNNSETRKEGIKFITQSVIQVLTEKREATYPVIVNSITTSNNNTKIRRIYDVLNVLRAIKVITKTGKTYQINDSREIIYEKKMKRQRLKMMIESIGFLLKRNQDRPDCLPDEKLFLPFMIIYADKESEIHCNTNEDRTFYNITSDKSIHTMKDLIVLNKIKKIYESTKKK